MKTVREEPSGNLMLRLVHPGKGFAGIIIKGAEIKVREDGADPDDVWRRLLAAAASLTPHAPPAQKARTVLRKAKLGHLQLRLEKTDAAIIGLALDGKEIRVQEEGQNADDVWRRLHDAAARLNPLFIGYSSARARFLHFFPDGFPSERYVSSEREYKLQAKALLEASAPLDAVNSQDHFGKAVAPVFATNLLDQQFEVPRVRDLLNGPAGDNYVRLCAEFARGDPKLALQELDRLLKPHNLAKWVVVTYLPFLWLPQEHVFLKPTMLRTFAERVGHRFATDYHSSLKMEVYEALLDLARETQLELADMGPRDMIDIQSFMWTVVEYTEKDGAATS